MVKILLDTNAFIWLVGADPERIGPLAKRQIMAADAVFISAASVFEIEIKRLLGKLDFPGSPVEVAAASNLQELAISAAHAGAIQNFPELARHDPFDRLLLAQAFCDGLEFFTADKVLLGLQDSRLAISDVTK